MHPGVFTVKIFSQNTEKLLVFTRNITGFRLFPSHLDLLPSVFGNNLTSLVSSVISCIKCFFLTLLFALSLLSQEEVPFVRINSDGPGKKPMMAKYGIAGYPTFMIFYQGQKSLNTAVIFNHATPK
jgi:hypothetical protein